MPSAEFTELDPAKTPAPEASRLHVCHVDPEKGFSGGEVQVFLLIDGLRQRGYRCSVITQPGSRVEAAAKERGLEVATVPMGGDWQIRGVWAMSKVLRAWKPDLVHLHTGRANWLGGWAAWRAGVPAVSTRRMDRPVRQGWKTQRIYGRWVRRTAAISPSVLRALHAGGVSPEATELIWSSVNPARVQPKRSREQVRAELQVEPEECVNLTAGALVRRKGIDFLLQVLASMEDSTRLWIAGNGPERESLAAQAEGLGLGPRVTFLGQRADLGDYLGAADVYLMPSRAEGLGVAALEAMAAGLPCLVSQVGGLADLVARPDQGVLLDPTDQGAWRDAWTALLADRGRRTRMGQAARERIAQGFLPEQMVAAYETFYRRACPTP